jgi:hypothetical protein
VSGRGDALHLLDGIERHHPDPFRNVSRETMRRQVERATAVPPDDRSRAIVELMRLGALLGERNGHTGILPLREHPRPFTVFPIRLHEFEDGVFVVAADAPELVGCELVAVAGTPLTEVMAAVTPLVPRDNEWTVRERRPRFVAVAEVLQGLGVIEKTGGAAFRFGDRTGGADVELEPLLGPEWARVVEEPREERRIDAVEDGRVLHVTYNVTRGDTSAFAAEIAHLARIRGCEALVLDLRHNAGGDNTSYGPLLELLETWSVKEGKRLTVLISRVTFSAAMQLVLDLEQRTSAVFVGEPTGASPNHYGDAVSVELEGCGVTARVATISWLTAGETDERSTKEPDLHVRVESAVFFAGEDPVLSAALELLRSG